MRRLDACAAALEGVTGLALMFDPAIVAQLLLGDGVSGAGIAVGRVAGVALLSLAIACWPGRKAVDGRSSGRRALLAYNLLVTLYFLALGLGGESVGRLLWPAIGSHALLTLLLARAWLDPRSFPSRETER